MATHESHLEQGVGLPAAEPQAVELAEPTLDPIVRLEPDATVADALDRAEDGVETALVLEPGDARRHRAAWARRGWGTAVALAVGAHLAIGVVAWGLGRWWLRPSIHSTGGVAEGGIIERSTKQGSFDSRLPPIVELPESAITGDAPPVAAPPALVTADDWQSVGSERLDISLQTDDAPLIGVPRSESKTPSWPSRRPGGPAAKPSPAATRPGAMAAAAQGRAPVRAAFEPPRGAGAPGGSGGVGNGFDDRGLPIPDYPPESRRRHEEGVVEVDVEVTPEGAPARLIVVRSSGFPRLDQAAVSAVRAAPFNAGRENGRPVAAHVTVPFRFTLE